MTSLKQYLNRLNPISENSWNKVSTLFSEKRLHKSDYFVREGQKAVQIAFLQEGIVRAFYTTDNGKEYNKHFFTGPSFIGSYSSLITGKASKLSQQALSDCQILTADFSEFTALYPVCPDIETAARKLAEFQFVEKEEKEIELAVSDAERRYLLFRKKYPGLEQLIPQYHIASYLGISPTQLSRIRKKMLDL